MNARNQAKTQGTCGKEPALLHSFLPRSARNDPKGCARALEIASSTQPVRKATSRPCWPGWHPGAGLVWQAALPTLARARESCPRSPGLLNSGKFTSPGKRNQDLAGNGSRGRLHRACWTVSWHQAHRAGTQNTSVGHARSALCPAREWQTKSACRRGLIRPGNAGHLERGMVLYGPVVRKPPSCGREEKATLF